jgi:hypothetical protein
MQLLGRRVTHHFIPIPQRHYRQMVGYGTLNLCADVKIEARRA